MIGKIKMANTKSITVRDILANHIADVNKNMTYEDKVKLTQTIRNEIKENIGHGISQAYYDKIWKADTFKCKYIAGHVVNAFNRRGAYSNKAMFGESYCESIK